MKLELNDALQGLYMGRGAGGGGGGGGGAKAPQPLHFNSKKQAMLLTQSKVVS